MSFPSARRRHFAISAGLLLRPNQPPQPPGPEGVPGPGVHHPVNQALRGAPAFPQQPVLPVPPTATAALRTAAPTANAGDEPATASCSQQQLVFFPPAALCPTGPLPTPSLFTPGGGSEESPIPPCPPTAGVCSSHQRKASSLQPLVTIIASHGAKRS